jgi:hypothetical protein
MAISDAFHLRMWRCVTPGLAIVELNKIWKISHCGTEKVSIHGRLQDKIHFNQAFQIGAVLSK